MAANVDRLLEIMARLRDPAHGCPWDVEQTFETIAPYTIEEAYEVADSIRRNDLAGLRDELGDLLLQVVYHAQMAAETDVFDFEDVVAAICDKMVRRHPHVFGDAAIADATAQTLAWERQKADERRTRSGNGPEGGRESALDGVALALPALVRALKLQKRAALVGFDWPDASAALAKFGEEVEELRHELENDSGADRLEDELGDLLFTCVNVARKLAIDPETALRKANAKFERRFRRIEALLAADGDRRCEDVALDALEALWQRAKAEEQE
ncbi:MAG: nucleoside triphosphate pyrophosphohydrolase [Rhodospirillales bacterium]